MLFPSITESRFWDLYLLILLGRPVVSSIKDELRFYGNLYKIRKNNKKLTNG